jgi:hypothetical protein
MRTVATRVNVREMFCTRLRSAQTGSGGGRIPLFGSDLRRRLESCELEPVLEARRKGEIQRGDVRRCKRPRRSR